MDFYKYIQTQSYFIIGQLKYEYLVNCATIAVTVQVQ